MGALRQGRPFLVGDLVVGHAGGVDLGEGQPGCGLLDPHGKAQAGTFGHLHLEHEPGLPTRLVEQVGEAVAALGDGGGSVGEQR